MRLQRQIESKPKRQSESGFMLLAVVVMVALILIALAVAAPVVAKDLRRDKEVESMHRAQQYVRAIQLYQRQCKCASYPPSMEALEKGNNIRYLRKEWVDPLTGKSDWRLIHDPKTTVKGPFGEELAGLVAGLGSAAGMASPGGGSAPTTTAGTTGGCSTVSAGGIAAGLNGAQTCTDGTSGSSGSTGSSSSTGMFGDSGAGGIIKGVGSSRSGDSILEPNGQSTYETWEFWYDPRLDLLRKNVSITGGGIAGGGLGTGSGSSIGINQLNNLGGSSGSSGSTGNTGITNSPQ
jgi:type II secretory pathway pseudopilin PulG